MEARAPRLGILCYHRVVDDDDDNAWPYLERGTAVRKRTFSAQLAAIASFADVVAEDVALGVCAGAMRLERPAVWLTFDDGYRDALQLSSEVHAATVCVTTSAARWPLPHDAWYAVLLAAGRSRGGLELGHGRFDFDLTTRDGRARLVNGPERRCYLRAPLETREALLLALSQALDASPAAVGPYLDDEGLRSLVRAGWTVGSHGVTHAPYDTITRDQAEGEAARSREHLRAIGLSARTLALPDGVEAHVDVGEVVGYECLLGLGDRCATVGSRVRDDVARAREGSRPSGASEASRRVPAGLVQPRFLVPDDPRWPVRVLAPALIGGVGG
jgi:peptidoglycan/xylan/chitin deacetylase (PgdA/CDA1 family)